MSALDPSLRKRHLEAVNKLPSGLKSQYMSAIRRYQGALDEACMLVDGWADFVVDPSEPACADEPQPAKKDLLDVSIGLKKVIDILHIGCSPCELLRENVVIEKKILPVLESVSSRFGKVIRQSLSSAAADLGESVGLVHPLLLKFASYMPRDGEPLDEDFPPADMENFTPADMETEGPPRKGGPGGPKKEFLRARHEPRGGNVREFGVAIINGVTGYYLGESELAANGLSPYKQQFIFEDGHFFVPHKVYPGMDLNNSAVLPGLARGSGGSECGGDGVRKIKCGGGVRKIKSVRK